LWSIGGQIYHAALLMIGRSIRLLFFTREDFPTHRVDVEVLFGRELIGRGHGIDLVTLAESKNVASGPQDWHGRTAFVGPTAAGHGFVGRLLKQCLALWHDLMSLRLVQAKCYDAIQVRDKFLIAAIGVVVAHARGVRFFFWLSFPMPEADLHHARSGNARFPAINYVRGVLSGWLLYRWIIPKSDHVFVQSERMKEEICARGADPKNVTAVPMGVDLSQVAAARRRDPAAVDGETKLGYLGTLDANRHLGILVDMLGLLRQSGLPVRLLLVGDAHARRDRESLERRAAELGVSQHLEISGFLPHVEAMKRISGVDICLSPIHPSPIFRVASPTKLVEYLALGLPVVANTHPEQRVILRQSRAGLCVPWGARHFARGVRWMMRLNSAQLAAMGERGRLWVEEHRTYRRIADDVERKYLMLLAPGSQR
jgi:glycosyltransferase involved in cell wall biosynthesis